MAFALAFASTIVAQKIKIDKDFKMYSRGWNDIVNKEKIDSVTNKNFETNAGMAINTEDKASSDGFKAYYQNFLTGFAHATFTVQNTYKQDDQLAGQRNFKGTHIWTKS